jgi:hypothetical protein
VDPPRRRRVGSSRRRRGGHRPRLVVVVHLHHLLLAVIVVAMGWNSFRWVGREQRMVEMLTKPARPPPQPPQMWAP